MCKASGRRQSKHSPRWHLMTNVLFLFVGHFGLFWPFAMIGVGVFDTDTVVSF